MKTGIKKLFVLHRGLSLSQNKSADRFHEMKPPPGRGGSYYHSLPRLSSCPSPAVHLVRCAQVGDGARPVDCRLRVVGLAGCLGAPYPGFSGRDLVCQNAALAVSRCLLLNLLVI